MQEFLASTNFTVIFISLIAIKFLLETYLKIRNLKSIELNKDTIPERFTSVVTEEEYKKSIEGQQLEKKISYLDQGAIDLADLNVALD